jgi:hypothetical protein
VTKSLAGVLFVVVLALSVAMMVITKAIFGPLLLLAMAALYFVLTVVVEALKLFDGKKVQGRDRHP